MNTKNLKDVVATFSIAAADPETEELGIAVQSKFIAVGSVVPWAKAGVGAVATQSWANTSLGPKGIALLEEGRSPREALEMILAEDDGKEFRQVGMVDAQGNAASFTGKECFDWAGGVTGKNYACQGNILVNEETVTRMAEVFEQSTGELASRLLEALDAAQEAGGDSRGKQSAALLVVKPEGGYGGYNDRYIDLRVDDHPDPIKELIRLHGLYMLYFSKTKPENILKIEGERAEKIVLALNRLAYFQGEYPGEWTAALQEALKRYYLTENFDDRIADDGYIDGEVLDFMMSQVAE
ncbi:MAG: DUF1028 domain-containing protein [Firmicutes bacterium]|nr:DUF1028 domain-containing protein [Bacillota bacterium]